MKLDKFPDCFGTTSSLGFIGEWHELVCNHKKLLWESIVNKDNNDNDYWRWINGKKVFKVFIFNDNNSTNHWRWVKELVVFEWLIYLKE